MPLVDFHTHTESRNDSSFISIESLDVEQPLKLNPKGLYSVGIHPWQSQSPNLKNHIERVTKLLENDSVIALGEVGLDKLRGESIENQKILLEQQVILGYNLNKPIIIHCVKAWNDLLDIKKSFSDNVPWAIHGFNGSVELTKQLIDWGFYLSVGPQLLSSKAKILGTINKIPLNRLFLETDDSDYRIDDIYIAASEKLNLSMSNLEDQLYRNFQSFFNVKLNQNS